MKHLPHKVVNALIARRKSVWSLETDEEVAKWFSVPWLKCEWHASLLARSLIRSVPTSDGSRDASDADTVVTNALRLLDPATITQLDLTWTGETSTAAQRYWAADALAEECRAAGRLTNTVEWFVVGEATADALRIVQLAASKSDGAGTAYNGVLERVCRRLVSEGLLAYVEAEKLVLKARCDDALPPQAGEDMRQAFCAAWQLGKYALAYELVTS